MDTLKDYRATDNCIPVFQKLPEAATTKDSYELSEEQLVAAFAAFRSPTATPQWDWEADKQGLW